MKASPLRGIAGGLLWLYPRPWRERYGSELRDTLAAHHVTTFTLLDLALGALDARRHPELLPSEVFSMATRMRSSIVAIFVAYLVFAYCWIGMLHVFLPVEGDAPRLTDYPGILAAAGAVGLAGAAALLALVVGGLPLLGATLVRAMRSGDRRVAGLIGVALLALLAFLGLAVWAATGGYVALSHADEPDLFWPAVGVAVVTLGTAAIARTLWLSELDIAVLRSTLHVGAVVVAAMSIAVVAGLALAIIAVSQAPAFGVSVLPLIPMVLAAGWSAISLRQGLTAR